MYVLMYVRTYVCAISPLCVCVYICTYVYMYLLNSVYCVAHTIPLSSLALCCAVCQVCISLEGEQPEDTGNSVRV